MNRTLVQRNLRSAILAGGIAAVAFAGAFVTAVIWVG
jgi:hypothetical protein